MDYVEKMLDSYLACALWTARDENDTPLDRSYSVRDFSPNAVRYARAVCKDFHDLCKREGDLLVDVTPDMAGYDLWLTQNHHGVGFWDRGLIHGKRLTDFAEKYGEKNVFVGDDGNLVIE